MELDYQIATEEDIPLLTNLMTITFDDDTRKFLGKEKGGPDGYDNGDFFRRWMVEPPNSTGYKIIDKSTDEVIGFFLVFEGKEGQNALGNIFIHPAFQHKGIGYETWKFIEKTFKAKSWILDTPSWAVRNHHFYEKKCGFKKVDERPFREEGVSGSLFIYLKEL